MKKSTIARPGGKIDTVIYTKSTMPNMAKKRVRHKPPVIKQHKYVVDVNIAPLVNCILIILLLSEGTYIGFKLFLLILNALMIVRIQKEEVK